MQLHTESVISIGMRSGARWCSDKEGDAGQPKHSGDCVHPGLVG